MKNNNDKKAIALHKKLGGKIRIMPAARVANRADLALVYTPGVAAVSMLVAKDNSLARDYTIKGRMVAVISDGSAVLGLGNIKALGALPVMEGKCALFKTFADVDAVPLVLDTQNADEIVETVMRIAPAFGGINLEDIASPKCFDIERRLVDALDIPVMHDDQHGTAVVVLAALLNACRVTKRKYEDLNIVVCGAGAAGYSISRLLRCIGYDPSVCTMVREISVCDTQGIIHRGREGLYNNKYKFILSEETNHAGRTGTLAEAVKGADVVIGVSAPGIITKEMVRSMNRDPIVFAMANPVPEIWPDAAKEAGAAVVGTGRSDFSNQINNVLAFPGIFRGALDARAKRITDEMKIAAAHAIADYVKKPHRNRIMPSILDKGVTRAVAKAVAKAAASSVS